MLGSLANDNLLVHTLSTSENDCPPNIYGVRLSAGKTSSLWLVMTI